MSLPPISIDDMNTTLIQYKGNWLGINGSTRQWDGSVHTTSQAGATATFQFRGYLLWVWGTIPAGVGSNTVQLSIDGGPGNITSRTANGSSVFNELYFETPLLPETFHTAVLTVLTTTSSTTNESTEFQLDRFEFQTSVDPPLFAPPGMSIEQTSSVTSPATPSATATPLSKSSGPSSSKSPIGAIAGGVIGALVLVIAFLLFLLWKRRKGKSVSNIDDVEKTRGINGYFPTAQSRSSLLPTPFPPIQPNNQSHNIFETQLTEPISPIPADTNSQPSQPNFIPVSEKSVHQPESSSFSNSHWTAGSPSPRTPGSASSTLPHTSGSMRSPSSPSDDGVSSEFLLERRDVVASIHHLTDHPSESPRADPTLSPSTDIYERPPPSYWYSENGSHETP